MSRWITVRAKYNLERQVYFRNNYSSQLHDVLREQYNRFINKEYRIDPIGDKYILHECDSGEVIEISITKICIGIQIHSKNMHNRQVLASALYGKEHKRFSKLVNDKKFGLKKLVTQLVLLDQMHCFDSPAK